MNKIRVMSIILLVIIVTMAALFIDRENILFWPLVILTALLAIMQAKSEYDNYTERRVRQIEFLSIARMLKQPESNDNSYLRTAYNLLEKGFRKAGLEYLKKAIEFEPENTEALMSYGTILLWDITWPYHLGEKGDENVLSKRLRNVAYYFKRALEIDPNHFMADVNYGVLLSECRKFKAAFKHLQKAIKNHPKLPIARQQLGIAKSRNGQIEEAIRLYKEERDLFGLSAHLAFSFGEIYEATGKLLLSQLYYEYAIRNTPSHNYLAHQRYIRVVVLRGEFQKGFKSHILLLIMFLKVRYLKNIIFLALLVAPFNIMYFFFVIIFAFLRKIKLISRNAKYIPKWVRLFYYAPYEATSKTMIIAGFYEEAVGACRKGLLIRPNDKALLSRISVLYSWLDDYKTAIFWARRFCEIYPKEPAGWHSLMGYLAVSGHKEEAVKCAKRALELLPKNADPKIVKVTQEYAAGDLSSIKSPLKFADYDKKRKKYWIFEKGKPPHKETLTE